MYSYLVMLLDIQYTVDYRRLSMIVCWLIIIGNLCNCVTYVNTSTSPMLAGKSFSLVLTYISVHADFILTTFNGITLLYGLMTLDQY